MNSKLFGASILVLGMAAFAPAFAGTDVDVDNNAVALLGAAGSADDGSNATGVGNINAPETENVAIYAPKTETETTTKIDTETTTKTSTDNSKSTKDSFNSDLEVKESFNTDTENKDSFNSKTELSSKSETTTKTDNSQDHSVAVKDSFNSKDSHDVDIDNSKETKNEDSFNSETKNEDSFNTKTELTSKSETKNEDSFNKETKNEDSFNTKTELSSKTDIDNSHTTKDSWNTSFDYSVEVVNKADLHAVSALNIVATVIGGVENSAKMDDGANSNWSGLNQVGIVGGANNTTQMNQQVSAHVGTLNLQ